MDLVRAVQTLVYLLQSDVTFQSYPLFFVPSSSSQFGYGWPQSMRRVPAVLTLAAFLESGCWLSSYCIVRE
eukprot:scaffold45462_cov28-Attheya_sp.AAC.1